MVVFTCGHCGESVQKPKVEKHYLTKCRNQTLNLSCMDCFKDFIGNTYETHTKCVTEEERYSGKGFVAKEKKGEKKQNAWVEMLQSVLDEEKNASKNVLKIIESISKHNNTPRKKPKFINFVKNVCGHKTNLKDIDQAWDLISVKLSALSNLSSQSENKNQNKDVEINGSSEAKPNNGNTDSEQVERLDEEHDGKESEIEENHHANEHDNIKKSDNKKMSKKEKKEEKKRKKYEAELVSASAQPDEEDKIVSESTTNKKDKKKKNRTESLNNGEQESTESKNKKKRKRQDTVNSVNGTVEVPQVCTENNENEPPLAKEKTQKKKVKLVGGEDANESVCLHDQNVANSEDAAPKSDKFNWHAVIMSVLEKKGNEVPFKRLQKKVLGEYTEATGREVDDRIAEKFVKKLKSAPNVRVDKNRVFLIE